LTTVANALLNYIIQAVQPIVQPPQYAPAPCKWRLQQPPRAFSLEVTAHRCCGSSCSISTTS